MMALQKFRFFLSSNDRLYLDASGRPLVILRNKVRPCFELRSISCAYGFVSVLRESDGVMLLELASGVFDFDESVDILGNSRKRLTVVCWC